MRDMMLRRLPLLASALSLALLFSGCIIGDNNLSFRTTRTTNGDVITVDYYDVVEEPAPSGGGTKVCICRAMHFRALQLASIMWMRKQIDVDELEIASGVNTPGPDEFEDALTELGVVIDQIDVETSIPNEHLGLCSYSILVTNTALRKQVRISPRPALFSGETFDHNKFFGLRTKMKLGTATDEEEKLYKKTVRPGVVQNLENIPLENMFEVAQVFNPGSPDYRSLFLSR